MRVGSADFRIGGSPLFRSPFPRWSEKARGGDEDGLFDRQNPVDSAVDAVCWGAGPAIPCAA